jgi:hypothetical protein
VAGRSFGVDTNGPSRFDVTKLGRCSSRSTSGLPEVESPNHERALILDTRDSKVLWLRTGLKPAVMAEGCD